MHATTNGFVTVPRLETDLLGDEMEVPQTNRGAWLWLFDKAEWKQQTRRFGRFAIDLQRGEIACSLRFLARAWNWSHGRVQRWLKLLADRAKITIRTESGIVVISLHGYSNRAESNPESQKTNAAAARRPVDDQRSSRRRIQVKESGLEKEGGLGRCAPSPPPPTDEEKAAVDELVQRTKAALTGKGPKFIRDPEAYEAARAKYRHRNWLMGLARWVGQRFEVGDARWEAEAAINEGLAAGAGALTPEPARGLINRLVELRTTEATR